MGWLMNIGWRKNRALRLKCLTFMCVLLPVMWINKYISSAVDELQWVELLRVNKKKESTYNPDVTWLWEINIVFNCVNIDSSTHLSLAGGNMCEHVNFNVLWIQIFLQTLRHLAWHTCIYFFCLPKLGASRADGRYDWLNWVTIGVSLSLSLSLLLALRSNDKR